MSMLTSAVMVCAPSFALSYQIAYVYQAFASLRLIDVFFFSKITPLAATALVGSILFQFTPFVWPTCKLSYAKYASFLAYASYKDFYLNSSSYFSC